MTNSINENVLTKNARKWATKSLLKMIAKVSLVWTGALALSQLIILAAVKILNYTDALELMVMGFILLPVIVLPEITAFDWSKKYLDTESKHIAKRAKRKSYLEQVGISK